MTATGIRLVGRLDSPYVRRVAVSMALMRLPFTHEPLSVFGDYDRFAAINPLVKAPTLVLADGLVLMESGLILEHLQHSLPVERQLVPSDPARFALCQRRIGLALVACEKTVQIAYELRLRPEDKRHQPWLDRVGGQLAAAYAALDEAVAGIDADAAVQQDAITAAIAWAFTCHVLPDQVAPQAHPALGALSARLEAMPAFRAWPCG